jgi:hypothetical protein
VIDVRSFVVRETNGAGCFCEGTASDREAFSGRSHRGIYFLVRYLHINDLASWENDLIVTASDARLRVSVQRRRPVSLDASGPRSEGNCFMRVVTLRRGSRKLFSVACLGLLFASVGCGGGGGESAASAPTPAPGTSSADQAEAYKKAYGPTGKPKPSRDSGGKTH